jgi:hypothetical protein
MPDEITADDWFDSRLGHSNASSCFFFHNSSASFDLFILEHELGDQDLVALGVHLLSVYRIHRMNRRIWFDSRLGLESGLRFVLPHSPADFNPGYTLGKEGEYDLVALGASAVIARNFR